MTFRARSPITLSLVAFLLLAAMPALASGATVMLTLRTGDAADPESSQQSYQLVTVPGGKRSELMTGQRIPIPVTSFNAGSPPEGQLVPMTSYTYQNVGFSVEAAVWIRENGRIEVDVQVEDSQLVDEPGTARPTIATRSQGFSAVLTAGRPLRQTWAADGARGRYLEIQADLID